MKKKKTLNLTKTAIVTAMYVAITFTLSSVSFGYFQIRLAESFNLLSVFNKRYVYAVTLGCAIANLFSPLGIIDVVVGSLSTLSMLYLGYELSKRTQSIKIKMIISILCTIPFMFPIALELYYFYNLPLVATYISLILSECLSMGLGAIVIYQINKRMDLSK